MKNQKISQLTLILFLFFVCTTFGQNVEFGLSAGLLNGSGKVRDSEGSASSSFRV